MKKLISLLIATAALAALAFTACSSTKGSGDIISRTVTLKTNGKLKELEVSNGIIANYTLSPKAKTITCTIKGPRKFNERVKVSLDDGELEVRTVDRRGIGTSRHESVIVNITAPAIADFEGNSGSIVNICSPLKTDGKITFDASSGAIINVSKTIAAKSLDIDASSGCAINFSATASINGKAVIDLSSGATTSLSLTCSTLSLDLSSGAIATVSGSAATVVADLSSGAIVNADKLKVSDRFTVDASSGAIVNCHSSLAGKVKIDKSSGAIVNYK